MINRRNFIKNTGALALGGLALPYLSEAASLLDSAAKKAIGIQLYTVTRLIGNDIKGMLQKLAELGFKEIESAGSPKGYYYGLKPKELAALIESLGMKWTSHHVRGAPRPKPTEAQLQAMAANKMPAFPDLPTLRDNYQQLVDEAAEGGLPFLVCASTPVATLDEIKASIEVFNKTGEACKKAGIQFAYHNHATEFDLVEGQRPYDLILSQTDKDLVKMELDLAWAVKAKQDPAALFKGNPGRFPLWHVKDITTDNKITEVGNGIVDFKKAFAEAKTAGMKHFFYEQDLVESMDSVATSIGNLKKILK